MDYNQESSSPQEYHHFSRRNITETIRVLTTGEEKRVAIVNVRQNGEVSPAVLKLIRTHQLVNTFNSIPLSQQERRTIMEEETTALAKLKKIVPSAVPALLGTYDSNHESNYGYLVELIDGKPIADKHLSHIEPPPPAAIVAFEKSINNLTMQGIYLSEDSIAPHNLLFGTTPTIKEPSIIMVEPRLINLEPENVTKYYHDVQKALTEIQPVPVAV